MAKTVSVTSTSTKDTNGARLPKLHTAGSLLSAVTLLSMLACLIWFLVRLLIMPDMAPNFESLIRSNFDLLNFHLLVLVYSSCVLYQGTRAIMTYAFDPLKFSARYEAMESVVVAQLWMVFAICAYYLCKEKSLTSATAAYVLKELDRNISTFLTYYGLSLACFAFVLIHSEVSKKRGSV